MDEDRPTVLRRLMSIENKVDTLIDRNQIYNIPRYDLRSFSKNSDRT
jgi:hypothetical protein